jgi:hypothetical protein
VGEKGLHLPLAADGGSVVLGRLDLDNVLDNGEVA